jgi:hypothetical protein
MIFFHYTITYSTFAKDVKDEYANKLTPFKLIAYNDKMPVTNNMKNLKSLECPCFRICNIDIQIIE